MGKVCVSLTSSKTAIFGGARTSARIFSETWSVWIRIEPLFHFAATVLSLKLPQSSAAPRDSGPALKGGEGLREGRCHTTRDEFMNTDLTSSSFFAIFLMFCFCLAPSTLSIPPLLCHHTCSLFTGVGCSGKLQSV